MQSMDANLLALVRDGVCAAWDCLWTKLASRMMLRMLVELRLALEDPLRRLGLPWGTNLGPTGQALD
jgi:hypothetical protein